MLELRKIRFGAVVGEAILSDDCSNSDTSLDLHYRFSMFSLTVQPKDPGKKISCADPESFVSEGPTLIFFSLMRGGRIRIQLLAGHQWPASKIPFKWCFAGVPMTAQH